MSEPTSNHDSAGHRLHNVAELMHLNAQRYPDHEAFEASDGRGSHVSSRQFASQVAHLGQGLITSGVNAGERVLIMAPPSYEWTLTDFALLGIGAISVPVYETSSPMQICWIIRNSGARHAVVQGSREAALVREAAEGSEIKVWVIAHSAISHLSDGSQATREDYFSGLRSTDPEDVATIMYTSGTAGRPKGVTLTHRNLRENLSGFLDTLDDLFQPSGVTTLYLSLAHIFSRTMQWASVINRVRIAYVPSVDQLPRALRTARPTFLPAIPRTLEKLHHEAGSVSDALGGRCTSLIVGGAPLADDVAEGFQRAGVTVFEGYGLTETGGPATMNGPRRMKRRTCGRPLSGVTVRLADDGEIFVKGACVFTGYWRDPAATAKALTDGWLRTGDIGDVDDQGYLRIIGRKRELIITSGGKNVDYRLLEERLRSHPLVSNAIVLGDRRPFVACLVTVDTATWRKRRDILSTQAAPDAISDDPLLRDEIQAAVTYANEAVSRAESIRAFRILANEFSTASGELTPSYKLSRQTIAELRSREIDSIYQSNG